MEKGTPHLGLVVILIDMVLADVLWVYQFGQVC
jgi:hypothetical protein